MDILNDKRTLTGFKIALSIVALFAVALGLSVTVSAGGRHVKTSENKPSLKRQLSGFKGVVDFDIKHPRLWWCRGKVLRVIDGDTYEVLTNCAKNEYSLKTVRLLNVDTPEIKYRPGGLSDKEWEAEKREGKKATRFVKQRIEHREVLIKITGRGNFGRALSKIQIPNKDKTLNETLQAKGWDTNE